MIKYEVVRDKLLLDPEVQKEYEAHRSEFEIARSLIQARLAAKMTQAEVAKKMHTSQSQIARMESGEHLPTIQSIHRYAQALNRKILFEIRP